MMSSESSVASEWRKHGVAVSPDHIPGRINNFASASIPLGGNRWRFWHDYKEDGRSHIGFTEGTPGGNDLQRTTAALGESPSGDAPLTIANIPSDWEPRQPAYLRLKDGRHRLYFWTTAPGVIRYLAADSEDGRRFKVVDPHRGCFYHFHDRAVEPNDIPDGLTPVGNLHAQKPAHEPDAEGHLVVNDATTVYQLPDGSFEAYTSTVEPMPADDPGYVSYDNAAGYRRFIQRFVSDDGLRWKGPAGTIRTDAEDPPDLQFYYLTVTHTPQGRIGLLGYYRCEAQTIDIEVCFSADGIHWDRPRRGPWLPRGASGQADCYAIMASHCIVPWKGGWWLSYTGYNFSHNHQHSFGPEVSSVLLAEIDALPVPPQ